MGLPSVLLSYFPGLPCLRPFFPLDSPTVWKRCSNVLPTEDSVRLGLAPGIKVPSQFLLFHSYLLFAVSYAMFLRWTASCPHYASQTLLFARILNSLFIFFFPSVDSAPQFPVLIRIIFFALAIELHGISPPQPVRFPRVSSPSLPPDINASESHSL